MKRYQKSFRRAQNQVLSILSQESKAYRFYDPSSKRIVISRDVILDEDATWDWSKENHKAKELSIEDDEKQEVVTLSTTEAEYVTATTCACHCVWLKDLLEEQAGTVEVIEFVNKDVVQQKFCRPEEQLADLMTKPLKLSIFEFIRGEIEVPAVKQAT
nr:hypothetical protein [Tanacetum cinerariifolium]